MRFVSYNKVLRFLNQIGLFLAPNEGSIKEKAD